METNLNVKRVEQTKDFDCSLGCVAMIMNFYGEDINLQNLQEELSGYVNKDERHIEASAIFLLKQGYEVFFQNYNLRVLGDNLTDRIEKDIDKFQNELNNLSGEDPFKKTKLKLALEYIQKGGKLSTFKPTIQIIKDNLEKGTPVIVGVNNAELRQNTEIEGNHYVVVSGIDDEEFIITDPSPNFPEPYKVKKDTLEKAWYKMGAYLLVAHK